VKRKELPEEWEWKKLGELLEIKSGYGFPERYQGKTDGDVPFFKVSDLARAVDSGSCHLENSNNYVTNDECKKLGYKALKKGTIVFAKIGMAIRLNRRAILKQDSLIDNNMMGVLNKSTLLDDLFLYYFLRSLKFEDYSRGTTAPSLRKSDIDQIQIPLPPINSQQQIVAILNKAEATQRLQAEADALMQQLVQSVYISIFGDPVSNPQGWDIVSLESVCKKITDGEHVTPKRTQSGIYLLSARNIKDHEIDLSDVDYIDQDEYNRISKRIIPQKGDVLISCSGSVGRVSQVTDDMKFQMVRSVALIRPDNQKLDSTYLEYTFDTNYLKAQIAQSVNQSSQANLFQNKIRKLRIPVPPMHLQKIFVDVAVRKGRISEKQRLNSTKTQTLYNSLLSKAFTGELVP